MLKCVSWPTVWVEPEKKEKGKRKKQRKKKPRGKSGCLRWELSSYTAHLKAAAMLTLTLGHSSRLAPSVRSHVLLTAPGMTSCADTHPWLHFAWPLVCHLLAKLSAITKSNHQKNKRELEEALKRRNKLWSSIQSDSLWKYFWKLFIAVLHQHLSYWLYFFLFLFQRMVLWSGIRKHLGQYMTASV